MKYLFYDDALKFQEENKNDILENLKESGNANPTEKDIFDEIDDMLFYEKCDLFEAISKFDNKKEYEKILVVGCLGLWNGIKQGKKEFSTLGECIDKYAEDTNYLQARNCSRDTITLKAIHHDGINYFKFYKLVNGKKNAITINEILNCY